MLPTINLTAGCLHDCVYCYIRGYRNYPGESRVVLYEDTLERLRHELRPGQPKPRAVYFSPSSDLFQPAPEVSELSHAVLEFLFSQGVGVAFLTKGEIPDETLELLVDHADLVQAQIGLITLDEEIARVFEPHSASLRTRLWQLRSLKPLIRATPNGLRASLNLQGEPISSSARPCAQVHGVVGGVLVKLAQGGIVEAHFDE